MGGPEASTGNTNDPYSQEESPGSAMWVAGAGFAPNSQISFLFDGNPISSDPSPVSTDGTGTLGISNQQLTVPSDASAGTHTITLTDADGNSATTQITVD